MKHILWLPDKTPFYRFEIVVISRLKRNSSRSFSIFLLYVMNFD